ncbi:MAG TPA: PhnD/SsuA/transferrin family substrate-binding protein, partial [Verrucomicrobiae bacterium]|nr:PhnD/SsuA/transferrin family substrate-binding protein [Verrucomicrobiae bacterium]
MKRWSHWFRVAVVWMAFWLGVSGVSGKDAQAILFVVLDPLAKELACACVKGYGQRDYRKLAARLESALKQPVSIEFSDDLAETLKLATAGQEVIVVGEQSRVAQDSKKAGLKSHPICELTDPDGSTTIAGTFVVRASDSAKELKDISGRKLIFGLADTEQNHSAVQAALRTAGAETQAKSEKRDAYNIAALDMLDSSATPPPVAVIPGYGPRLLEGCGSVKRGELRVIGQTEPLPFIAVFVADNISAAKREKIQKTLLDVKSDAKLLNAIESRDGFKPIKPEA